MTLGWIYRSIPYFKLPQSGFMQAMASSTADRMPTFPRSFPIVARRPSLVRKPTSLSCVIKKLPKIIERKHHHHSLGASENGFNAIVLAGLNARARYQHIELCKVANKWKRVGAMVIFQQQSCDRCASETMGSSRAPL